MSVDQIDFGQEQFSLRGPDFVTIENLTVTYTRVWGTADGIVLRNLTGKTFDIFGGVGKQSVRRQLRTVRGDSFSLHARIA